MRGTFVGLVCAVLIGAASSSMAEPPRDRAPVPPRPAARLDTTSRATPGPAPGVEPAEGTSEGERRRDAGPRDRPEPASPGPPRAAWGSTGALDRHVQRTLQRATEARQRRVARPPGTAPATTAPPPRGGAVPGGTDRPAVPDGEGAPPTRLAFGPVFPNPSAGDVVFRVDLPTAGNVRIRVIDVAGRIVDEIRETRAAGRHSFAWNGRSRAPRSGVYFACLDVNGRPVGNRRVVVVR